MFKKADSPSKLVKVCVVPNNTLQKEGFLLPLCLSCSGTYGDLLERYSGIPKKLEFLEYTIQSLDEMNTPKNSTDEQEQIVGFTDDAQQPVDLYSVSMKDYHVDKSASAELANFLSPSAHSHFSVG